MTLHAMFVMLVLLDGYAVQILTSLSNCAYQKNIPSCPFFSYRLVLYMSIGLQLLGKINGVPNVLDVIITNRMLTNNLG
jgi:hypothetical protein